MRLDVRRLAWSTMLVWAGWYTICAALVAIAPGQLQSVLSFALHYELTAGRAITLGGYLGGMLLSTAWIGLFGATIGWCYNALRADRRVGLNLGEPAAQR